MVGPGMEHQRTFGAESGRIDLALDVAAAKNQAAAQPCGGADAEFLIRGMGIGRSPLGLADQPEVGLGQRLERGVVLVIETELLFHNSFD